MRRKKLFSLLCAAVSAAALTTTASASIAFPENHDEGLSGGPASWCVQVFNTGSPEEGKPAVDYGVDVEAIAQIRIRFTTDDPEWFEGTFGGSVITSCYGGTMTEAEVAQHNWPSNTWWGVVDEDLEIATQDPTCRCVTEKVGDYTYEIVCDIEQGYNNFLNTAGCVQIGVIEWGRDLTQMIVLKVTCLDASGNVLISFDEKGVATVGEVSKAPSAPTFTPDGGTFTEAQAVVIECTATGAEIYYTLDGSIPTENSTKYTAPVSVTESATLKAVAIKDGLSSAVTSADFTIDLSETEKSGFYSDGKTITEAALGEIVTQKTSVKDGKQDVRFIQKVNAADLSGKSKATFTLVSSEAGKTPQKVSTTKYYTGLTFDDGTKATAASGQVFLCYTVKDVPAGVTIEATNIALE